jgi:hypothetical protein
VSDADSRQNESQSDEGSLQRVHAYRQRHPEKVSEWNRDYYERNRERIKQRQTIERDTEK